ncbi:hypothetical protein [Burkholderia gladioli]|uniref:hypothetical protein n=1 Tax=Burkholderia gladioli TaxID=28095 RepID=UPI00163F01A2|nr:hypothetical protein [Burkholderia gladioli]
MPRSWLLDTLDVLEATCSRPEKAELVWFDDTPVDESVPSERSNACCEVADTPRLF